MSNNLRNKTLDMIEQYFITPSKKQLQEPFYITWAGHRCCGPEHSIGPRILDNFKIVFVAAGSGYLKQGEGEVRPVFAGDMFVLFPHEKHYYYANAQNPWELVWVSFNGTRCKEVLEEMGFCGGIDILRGAYQRPLQMIMRDLLNSMAREEGAESLRSIGMLYLMLAEIQSISAGEEHRQKKKQDVIEQAVLFIEENYYLPINMDTLCSYVNYSRSHISRLFNEQMGISVPAYITRVRVQKALRLLKSTPLSVKEVAASVGMEDSFYFSKVFKKETGTSPVFYRDSAQERQELENH